MASENSGVSLKEKGMVLYACLTLSGVSIEEAAEHFLDEYDETSALKVSLVLKSFGFNEKNLGKFVRLYSFAFKRSRFSELDINMFKQQDMAAFVQIHPDGGTSPEDMEKFLRARINERLHQQRFGNIVSPPELYDDRNMEELHQIKQPKPPEESEKTEKPAVTAPKPVKTTPDTEKSKNRSVDKENNADNSYKADEANNNNKAAQKPEAAGKPRKKWVGLIVAAIAALLVLFIFNAACGGTAASCAGGSGRSGCVSSGSISVNFNVGYFSDGSFEKAAIIIDDKYRTYLDEDAPTKFSTGLSIGRHTIRVEYYKNEKLYNTDSLEFNVNKNGDHVDLFVLSNNEKLVLMFTGT